MLAASPRLTQLKLHQAAIKGMRWLERCARKPEGFTSDEAQVFLTGSRSALDPVLTNYATRVHRRLVKSYRMDLTYLRRLGHPSGFIDYLSICVQSEELGFCHPHKQDVTRVVRKRGEKFFHQLLPRKHHYLNCLTLINYYLLNRLGLPTKWNVETVIKSCAAKALERSRDLSADEFEQQLYFVTHWAYALSDYGCRPLERRRHATLYGFLRNVLPAAQEYGNVEILSEVVGCLKIFGHHNGDRFLHSALRNLMQRQNPDGSWGSVAYDTVRHATCVAVLALYEYRAHRKSGWGPVAGHSSLSDLPN